MYMHAHETLCLKMCVTVGLSVCFRARALSLSLAFASQLRCVLFRLKMGKFPMWEDQIFGSEFIKMKNV